MEEEEEQLSNLPKTILHEILSRLPQKDAARTSVLSKAWAQTWYTFPFLSFSDTKIIGTLRHPEEDLLRKRKQFLDYVERTLLRFSDQGLAIKQFKLNVNCFDLHCLSKDLNLWLKLASESGVEVLELCNQEWEAQHRCYILPTGVLEAKSLTKLVLKNGIGIDLAFMNRSMKFSSLQVLSLEHVLLGDEHAFKHLISCCPFIEYITLRWCYVYPGDGEGRLYDSRNSPIKSLSMCGLPKLKGVDIQGIQEVYVDSPCLENLYYCPSSPEAPFKMDFNRCRNLRGLSLRSLRSTNISNNWFLELFAKFPFLESLKLENCSMSERINISSVQLKVLELSNCFNWKEVNINAPNLLSCVYVGYRRHATNTIPIISFSGCSRQLVVNVEMQIDYRNLCRLRESIQNFKLQTVLASVSLFIYQPIVDALNPVALQVSSPPPSIKHLVLHCVQENESLYLPLVYKLLSSCCPATISISLLSFPFTNRAFIEVFYETLMGRNEVKCFCNSGHTKCWWLGLKGVKVTSSINTDENADFKTMLDALLTTPASPKNISFRQSSLM